MNICLTYFFTSWILIQVELDADPGSGSALSCFCIVKKLKKWIRFSKIFRFYLQHTTMFISCPPPYYSIPTRITRITVIYAIDNSTCRYLRASPLGDLRGGRSHCEYKALVGVSKCATDKATVLFR